MKHFNKLLLGLIVTVFSAQIVSAQFGIRGGVNFANVSSSDESIELANTLGYQLGVVYELDITDNFLIRPGLMYSLKGNKAQFEDGDITTRSDYFEVPLDFHIKFGDPDDNRLGLYAGPYAAFLINVSEGDNDVGDLYKGADFGFNAGITYDIYFFTIGLNYGAGLTNIADDDTVNDVDIRNQTISAFGIFRF